MTVLIIGGANQGKLDFAKKAFSLKADEICSAEEKINPSAKCIYRLQLAVREPVFRGEFDAAAFERLRESCKDKIIISDDISCGIVPLDRKERDWREAAGRLLCVLAQSADTVIRIQCGIPQILKGKL